MKNALHIFPTNGEVNSHNSAMICKICKPIYTALAKDYFTDVVTGHLQQKDEPIISCTPQDLETELQIGIGARVMLNFNPNAISSSENITEALQQMPTFLSPQLVPEPSNLFTIVHHNTEGLLPHLSDVKAMKQFERADVICFTETWLSKHHTVDATLYPEYTRYNLLRSEAYNKDNILLSEKIDMNRGGVAIFVKAELTSTEVLI
ncbi:unnamed protein product [Mytilus coruscus]|uniref:Endonuclease/exonuclease/phosphatase domain-containing protein n=1 Tax=Mytilus coruscus TaxID=42192 RepID=A0A6J8EJN6_MYTCO|nr:unnamed protein product [Mytilus coruscus]